MAKNIIFDTGYWFALYDERKEPARHEKALLLYDYLAPHIMIIPWPSLYETLNTRFVRREQWLSSFKKIIHGKKTVWVYDDKYRSNALESIFSQAKSHRKCSLVDLIIRDILLDVTVKIDAIVTFNIEDFDDICRKRNIEMFDG